MAKKKAAPKKKKATAKKEVNLDVILLQIDALTKLVGQLTESTTKPTKPSKVKKIVEEIEEEVEQDPDLYTIHDDKKVKRGKLVTKAKCKPTDPGGNKEVDKIKYPERKKNTRPPVQVIERECEYCSRPIKYIEGVIQDYACQRCLTGRK